MSDDCSQAFQCVDNDIYDGINDGCLYLCEEGEIMLPEFKTGLFMCRDNADDRYECPGHFRIHCDDDPVIMQKNRPATKEYMPHSSSTIGTRKEKDKNANVRIVSNITF